MEDSQYTDFVGIFAKSGLGVLRMGPRTRPHQKENLEEFD